ncbi:MAG TPA: hypothetical protein P5137_09675 [Candidatus Brocadiia bacterium]|nr:hypothetical protein [Candidatus Brocadiia bacterium]
MTASPAIRLAATAIAMAVLAAPLRAQDEDITQPKAKYNAGVCFEWKGGVSPARQNALAASLMALLKQVDGLASATPLDYRLDTYGPWPGPGLDKDFICYTCVTFSGASSQFTLLMRFYYTRGDSNIILPDIETTDYGEARLRSHFLRLFQANFPVEAQIVRKRDSRAVLSRGSDSSISAKDLFTPVTQSTEWWDVFSQPAYEVISVSETSSVMTVPATAAPGAREALAARLDALQPGQLLIRRNNDPGVYRTETNTFRIAWTDDHSPASGARIVYALGREGQAKNWTEGPQLLRDTVQLSLPAGVPVSIKAVLRRGDNLIEGKPRFIERWGPLSAAEELGLDPQYQNVDFAVVPDDVLPQIKIDGREVRERPLRLRWGTHSLEVKASADANWFPYTDTITVPVPSGRLTVNLQRDYKDAILDKLSAYYSAASSSAAQFNAETLEEEVVDRDILLIQAVSLMETCAPNHPQFLNVRYTLASCLTREGHYPEALLAMLNYNAGEGIGGAAGKDIRIVERGAWSVNNVRLPRKWAWDWYEKNTSTPLDRIELDPALRLPSLAITDRLSAEDTSKIYNYLLGTLFYHYARGPKTGQPYLSDPLDRCLAYLIAYRLLDQSNFPTLAEEPYLYPTLNFYSKAYLLSLLRDLGPLVSNINQRSQEVRREYDQLRKSLSGSPDGVMADRVRREYSRLVFQMNLLEFHAQLTRRQTELAKEFVQYYNRLQKSDVYQTIDAQTRKDLDQTCKEIAKIDTVGGEAPWNQTR